MTQDDPQFAGPEVEHESLQFVELREGLREAFLDYCREFRDAGEPFRAENLKQAETDWAAFVAERRGLAAGTDLPQGKAPVPQTDYFLMRGSRIIGSCRLRQGLNDSLRVIGGHIGYDVRPSERGKGFATRMLALALEKARALGLERVLLTCDKDNAGSAQVIRKNGGVLEDEVISPRSGKPSQRYWITL